MGVCVGGVQYVRVEWRREKQFLSQPLMSQHKHGCLRLGIFLSQLSSSIADGSTTQSNCGD